jgi:hypothetical protein
MALQFMVIKIRCAGSTGGSPLQCLYRNRSPGDQHIASLAAALNQSKTSGSAD